MHFICLFFWIKKKWTTSDLDNIYQGDEIFKALKLNSYTNEVKLENYYF